MNENRAEHTLEEHRTVRVDRRLRATPTRVFDAWLDPGYAQRFMVAALGGELLAATIEPKVGGWFSFALKREDGVHLAHTGEYLAIERPQHLSFTWRVPRLTLETGVVTIDLEPAGEGETHLVLKHEGVLPEIESITEQGWIAILDSIEATLDETRGAAEP
jgi:uncharacterized protein YndB with AHSA1/START domain